MCLAVPGKLVDVRTDDDLGVPTGTIDFQGSRFDVNLSFTPEAAVGDWLLVHAGFAINSIDEDEAREVWEVLSHDESLAEQMPEELKNLKGSES
jgi:hydrogenase expression/formation protein HypC